MKQLLYLFKRWALFWVPKVIAKIPKILTIFRECILCEWKVETDAKLINENCLPRFTYIRALDGWNDDKVDGSEASHISTYGRRYWSNEEYDNPSNSSGCCSFNSGLRSIETRKWWRIVPVIAFVSRVSVTRRIILLLVVEWTPAGSFLIRNSYDYYFESDSSRNGDIEIKRTM